MRTRRTRKTRRARGFKRFKEIPRHIMALWVVALVVIVFTLVMVVRLNWGNEPAVPATFQSEVQAIIDEIDWIEQYFLPINRYSRPGISLDQVNGIVIHNIGNPGTTALQNRNFFANLAHTGERFASSNFIICLDGSILQCVPIDEIAYASNIRNYDTISIEVCHPYADGRFTEASYLAVVHLTAWLSIAFDLTSEDVIRHADIIATDCPRYFTYNEDAWERFRADVDSAIAEMRN